MRLTPLDKAKIRRNKRLRETRKLLSYSRFWDGYLILTVTVLIVGVVLTLILDHQ